MLTGAAYLVPCGSCYECCTAYANMWAKRCMDEASQYNENCMITLTYEETDGKLHKEHLQKFIKRLRRKLEPKRIRYYACGEYGGQRDRPHYHCLVFGYFPQDAKYICTKGGVEYYGSDFLEEVWKSDKEFGKSSCKGGFISITKLNFKACRYACKYLQKLDKREHSVKPFTVMSRKPGIGANAVDVSMLLNGVVYVDGKEYPIPKFYVDKLEQYGYNVDILKAKRKYIMQSKYGEYLQASAVDSARRRGDLIENRLHRMEGG